MASQDTPAAIPDAPASSTAASPAANGSRPTALPVMPQSEPLEMSDLHTPDVPPSIEHASSTASNAPAPSSQGPPLAPTLDPVAKPNLNSDTQSSAATDMPSPPTAQAPPDAAPLPPPAQGIHEEPHDSPILPATDHNAPISAPPASSDINAYVAFVLLLPSTGARHPFQIDAKYLRRRGIGSSTKSTPAPDSAAEPADNDSPVQADVNPWDISVYQVKELIWRDWRPEWEIRPSNPAGIRLIHFGRMLDDKLMLKDCRLTPGIRNVVHMSIKPQNTDEDDAGADKIRRVVSRRGRRNTGDEEEETRRSRGCACCSVQ